MNFTNKRKIAYLIHMCSKLLRRLLGNESEIIEHISEHHMTSRFKQFFQRTNFRRYYTNRLCLPKSKIIKVAKIFVVAFCQLRSNVFKEYRLETIAYISKIFALQICQIERKINVDDLQGYQSDTEGIVQQLTLQTQMEPLEFLIE